MMYCIGDTANYSDQFTRIYFSTSDKRASTRVVVGKQADEQVPDVNNGA
jgi:hypothetical protein